MTLCESNVVGHGLDAKIKEKKTKTKGREWEITECTIGIKVSTVCESVSIMCECVLHCISYC